MVNAAAKRVRKASVSATAPLVDETQSNGHQATNGGPQIMSVETVDEFEVQDLGDYEFTRQGAGRKREPSPFDSKIESYVGAGTKRIPVPSETRGNDVVKMIQKSADWKGRGLQKRVEADEDGNWFVIFTVHPEKAKRAPRKPKAETNGNADSDTADDGDPFETE